MILVAFEPTLYQLSQSIPSSTSYRRVEMVGSTSWRYEQNTKNSRLGKVSDPKETIRDHLGTRWEHSKEGESPPSGLVKSGG
jgi:hypothetical protein